MFCCQDIYMSYGLCAKHQEYPFTIVWCLVKWHYLAWCVTTGCLTFNFQLSGDNMTNCEKMNAICCLTLLIQYWVVHGLNVKRDALPGSVQLRMAWKRNFFWGGGVCVNTLIWRKLLLSIDNWKYRRLACILYGLCRRRWWSGKEVTTK